MHEMVQPEHISDPAESHGISRVPELERLQLQNLLLQQQLCREQLNVLTLHFLQTAQPKALHDRIEELTKQINTAAEKIFGDRNLDAQQYQLNVDEGVFVARHAGS